MTRFKQRAAVLMAIAIGLVVLALLWFNRYEMRGPSNDVAVSLKPLVSELPPPSDRNLAATSSLRAPVAASSSGAMPLPSLNTPLRLIYSDLKQLAEAGRVDASCRLSFELDRCSELKASKDFVREVRVRNSKVQQGTPDFERRAKWLSQMEKKNETAAIVCEEFSSDDAKDAWRYLLTAALSGHGPSMVRFVQGVGLGVNPQGPLSNLDQWVAYKEYAPAVLEAAIARGYPEAVEFASHAIERPMFGAQLLPKDPIRGLAYSMALLQVSSPRYQRVLESNNRFLIQKYGFTETDIAMARAQSVPIAAQITRIPEGGVDFSSGTFPSDDGRHCQTK